MLSVKGHEHMRQKSFHYRIDLEITAAGPGVSVIRMSHVYKLLNMMEVIQP